jgi:hypothetical protein
VASLNVLDVFLGIWCAYPIALVKSLKYENAHINTKNFREPKLPRKKFSWGKMMKHAHIALVCCSHLLIIVEYAVGSREVLC